jgi:DNA (cytosine-5)-methyltransferase 1
LFCGCGGFSLGMIQAGFEVVAGVENDFYAALTYMSNLGNYPIQIHGIEEGDRDRFNALLEKHVAKEKRKTERDRRLWVPPVSGKFKPAGQVGVSHFFFGDARKLTGARLLEAIGLERGDVDVVAGGPPCQGFSTAGKRDVMDPRNSLVFEFVRLVLEIYPKILIMENVPGILSMTTQEGIPVIDALARILEDGEYGPYESMVRALAGQDGARAILRGRKAEKAAKKGDGKRKGKPAPRIEGPDGDQLSLFDERVAS